MLFVYLANHQNLDNPHLAWRFCPDKASLKTVDPSLVETKSGNLEQFLVFYKNLNDILPSSKKKSKNVPLMLIIPGDLVTYATVTPPTKSKKQIKQAIPYMVEDFLVGDPEMTQISLGKINSLNQIPIAILDRSLFQKILSLFNEHELPIESASTIQNILDTKSCDLSMVFFEQHVYINSQNICIKTDSLNIDKVEDVIFGERIKNINLYYPEGDKKAFQKSNKMKISLQGHENVNFQAFNYSGDIFDIIQENKSDTYINLLHDLSSKTNDWYKNSANWTAFLYVLITLFVLQLSFNFGSAYFFNKRSSTILKKSETYYKSLFPDDAIIDLKSQWDGKLNGAKIADPRKNFSYLFSSMAKALSKNSTSSGAYLIQQFRYDDEDSELKMVIEVKSVSMLESVKDELKSQGIEMEILSANEDKSTIKASLLLRLL